jgi:hypothetical protein
MDAEFRSRRNGMETPRMASQWQCIEVNCNGYAMKRSATEMRRTESIRNGYDTLSKESFR